MGKITVPALAEFIAEATGFQDSNLRSISRRLREAGLISQAGHGRGAAEATPADAALLLLVSALPVPSLHAARIGAGIRACTDGMIFEDGDKIRVVDGSAIEHVSGLIAKGRDVDLCHIILSGSGLGVVVATEGEETVSYQMPLDAPEREALAAKFGRPKGSIVRMHRGEFRDGVLPEISEFLGIEVEGAEDTDA